MKKILRNIGILLLSATSIHACRSDDYTIPKGSFEERESGQPPKVELVKNGDMWRMLVNGENFYIKGVAANNFHERAVEFGANTARTYGVNTNTRLILDACQQAGVYVNFGLYMKRETDGFDYNNEAAVAAQFEQMKQDVVKFKDHPAILLWSIGNEAEARYTNTKLWDAINDVAEMIHEIDPDRPTTTVLASANVNHMKNIIEKAPAIDILSINSYAPTLPTLLGNIQSSGWAKPYMVTEYGPRGTWQMSPEPTRMLPWGALVEQTSSEKAAIYLDCYKKNIENNRANGCIGSFVFLWGYQTHGEVLNWYGLFDKQGYTHSAVDAMEFCWMGEYPKNRAPIIATRNDMKMNDKVAEEAIKVAPGSTNRATVVATDPDGDVISYEWIIIEEGKAASDGSIPAGIEGLIVDKTLKDITFTAPAVVYEKGYRLYVFVRDHANKKVATACIPFYVE